MRIAICLAFVFWMITPSLAQDPLSAFANGAEITSYKTVQPRYGESRTAYTVMVFVKEHVNRISRIKVEDYDKTPKDQRIQVIKLNRSLRFDTGIYDYAVMTSVFSSVGKEFGRDPFYPAKISLTASEWCGNFYEHLLPDGKGARRMMHSYFEKEGDRDDYLAEPAGGLYEDNLPILIREFGGEIMKPGDKKAVDILPALWESRISHKALSYEKGFLQKDADEIALADGKAEKTFRWTWQAGTRTVQYWVSREYPHIILRWKSSAGDSGERIKTLYSRYWNQNTAGDIGLRKELGLPIVR